MAPKKNTEFTKFCIECGTPAIKNSTVCIECGADVKSSTGMSTVVPIRGKKNIDAMKAYLKAKSLRDWALFTLGINSALRISDLLKLQISDVVDENGKIRERILVTEIKTSKRKNFPLNKSVIDTLTEYIASVKPSQTALFASRKGNEAITRQQSHVIISNAANACDIEGPCSNHSLRKTFATALYEAGVDLTRIQSLLNHSSPKETIRYIGLNQLQNDQVYLELNL